MRLDRYIAEMGLAPSRTRAEKLISSCCVTVDGCVVTKPSFDVPADALVEVSDNERFVGRGGYKLEGALDAFSVSVEGLNMIDVGASTGGFTDCLLQRGAASVLCVDSGRGQLHEKLLLDPRVRSIEGYNARNISSDIGIFDGAVMDVSFISQTLIIPSLVNVISDGGIFISLIKPQFEAGRAALGKGGIVKDAASRRAAATRVCMCAQEHGLCLMGMTVSPILGGDGNTEYLAYFKKSRDESDVRLSLENTDKISQICQ